MSRLLVFGGTADSRALTEALLHREVDITVSVTTGYGASLVPKSDRITLHVGPLDAADMAALMVEGRPIAVVDATHPYATEASRNIRAASREAGLPCLRLLRPAGETGGLTAYASVGAAVEALMETEGAVLAATGSKELDRYTALPDYVGRVCPRVLPTVDSVARCEALGFGPARIIAMQGPFAYELNLALMRHYDIRYMVTKDGGASGGFEAKIDAAHACGAEVLLVARPPEPDGLLPGDLLAALDTLLEVKP